MSSKIRLAQREVRDIRAAIEGLAALGQMLGQTTWQGAPAARVLLEQIWKPLAAIYNKHEVILPQSEWIPSEATEDAPPASSAAAAAGSYGKSQPGEPEG